MADADGEGGEQSTRFESKIQLTHRILCAIAVVNLSTQLPQPTVTPFQNATRPLISFAASLGSG